MRNKKRYLALLTAVILFAAVSACNHQGPKEAEPTVSFGSNVKPILSSSCAISTDCHVGSSNTNDHIDLTDSMAYNTIISKSLVNTASPTLSLLYNEINTGQMPKAPYSKLTATQINLILNWIKQGAKNN